VHKKCANQITRGGGRRGSQSVAFTRAHENRSIPTNNNNNFLSLGIWPPPRAAKAHKWHINETAFNKRGFLHMHGIREVLKFYISPRTTHTLTHIFMYYISKLVGTWGWAAARPHLTHIRQNNIHTHGHSRSAAE
jgi:hypothetical protein